MIYQWQVRISVKDTHRKKLQKQFETRICKKTISADYDHTPLRFTCSTSTIETLEESVKYFQS